MGVRANWFDAPGTTPNLTPSPLPTGGSVVTALESELATLVDRETELASCGVTCPIRDNPNTTCAVCPLSRHADALDPLQPLCKLGRRLDRVMTELVIASAPTHA